MKKLLLTGGGTAGHVTPHLALIPRLQNDFEIFYIGSYKGIEKSIIEAQGVPYKAISVGKLRRYFSWENLKDVFRVLRGTIQAFFHIRKLRPDVVFSKGGFVAVPVVLAAKLNRVPIVCHESDITPGIATKISAKFAQKVCTTFAECTRYFGNRGEHTGTPLRDSLFQGDASRAKEKYHLDNKPVLLIMGGSQGALSVNLAIHEIVDRLLEHFDILHLCGEGKRNESLADKAGYVQIEYLNEELADVLAAADIVISRAGSNSINELKALQKPMLLIPLPQDGVSRGDQVLNAKNYSQKGIAHMLMQEDITSDVLYDEIMKLYEQRAELAQSLSKEPAQNGAERVCEIIRAVAK